MRLHEGEPEIDAELVSRLLAEQFPDLAAEAVRPFRSTGTVNAIFRVGQERYARLPRLERFAASLDVEARWLPHLAPHLPLEIPEVLARGEPGEGYPFPWAICRWIEGRAYADDVVRDERRAARDLARFVLALRELPLHPDAPAAGRRPLPELDATTRASIAASAGLVDQDAVTAAWEQVLEAPLWDGERRWIHGDLLRPNLLVRDGRLSAVIDFGSVGAGDPAMDAIPGWAVFGSAARTSFRERLGLDDAAWARARGVALHQALGIVPYYAETNPAFTALAQRTIAQILRDLP